ncbi:MAG: hypothetical protein U0Z17_02915 [Bacteroidales bacterium]
MKKINNCIALIMVALALPFLSAANPVAGNTAVTEIRSNSHKIVA